MSVSELDERCVSKDFALLYIQGLSASAFRHGSCELGNGSTCIYELAVDDDVDDN